jgi:acetyl esterase/lipase
MSHGIDHNIAAILPLLPLKDAANLTPKRARDELVVLADSRKDVPLPQPASVEDITVEGAEGSIPARLYRASSTASASVVFFHGGGWVAGDLNTHDRNARALALALDAVVLSVDYRRPPEVRFPGALDDAVAATRWAARNIRRLGGDTRRLAVTGDSAGGQLAASVALACRDGGPPLKAQMLVYPATDVAGAYKSPVENAKYPSRAQNAEGYFLTADAMRFFASEYLSTKSDGYDWRVSPLRATSLKGLPPTVVCTAEFDPLCDEGDAYASALRDAGVEIAHFREPGMIHGYFSLGAVSPAAEFARLRACAAFKRMLI